VERYVLPPAFHPGASSGVLSSAPGHTHFSSHLLIKKNKVLWERDNFPDGVDVTRQVLEGIAEKRPEMRQYFPVFHGAWTHQQGFIFQVMGRKSIVCSPFFPKKQAAMMARHFWQRQGLDGGVA
jgi:hypothetical protein